MAPAEGLQLHCCHGGRQHSLREDLYFSLLDSEKGNRNMRCTYIFKMFFFKCLHLKNGLYSLWEHRLVQGINHSTVPENLNNNPFHQNFFLFWSTAGLLG